MKTAILLSLLSLGLAGFLAYDRWGGCTSCKGGAGPEAPATAALEDEVKDLRARLAALENKPELIPGTPVTMPITAGPGLATGIKPAGTAAPATEVAELTKRLVALEEYKAKAEEEAKARPQWARALGGRGGRFGNFYMTTDDAKEDLKLTDQQKADFDRIAADAKRELEEVWKTPDEDGKTMEQVTMDLLKPGANGQPAFDFSKVMNFGNKTIPGRNETYRAADKRIRDNAKASLRNTLSSEQQPKFDKANSDAMFGSPGMGAGLTSAAFAMPIGVGMSTDK